MVFGYYSCICFILKIFQFLYTFEIIFQNHHFKLKEREGTTWSYVFIFIFFKDRMSEREGTRLAWKPITLSRCPSMSTVFHCPSGCTEEQDAGLNSEMLDL